MFADEFLPVHDVPDEAATAVAADPPAVGEAPLAADLIEVGKRTPLAGLLGPLRVLPELVSDLLHGERPPHGPATLQLREITNLPPARAAGYCSASARARSSRWAWSASSGNPSSSTPMSQPSASATSTSLAIRKRSTRSASIGQTAEDAQAAEAELPR